MIESGKLVPRQYEKSRDYQVLLKLLDYVIVAAKSEIDNFINILNPDRCPDHMLPLLASYVGYKYDYNESYDANRMIIKYYNRLIRNRGSERGIQLAAALSVNAVGDLSDIEALSLFRVEFKEKEGKINLYVYYPRYMSKIRDLIEVVRPAGVRVILVPADQIDTIDKIDIHEYVKFGGVVDGKTTDPGPNKRYDTDRDTVGDKNRVGFGEVTDINNKGDES